MHVLQGMIAQHVVVLGSDVMNVVEGKGFRCNRHATADDPQDIVNFTVLDQLFV